MSNKEQTVVGIGLLILLLVGCHKFTGETISGTHPVKELELTHLNGKLDSLRMRIEQGVRLDSLVDISFFDGLDQHMSLESARQKLGEPHSVRTQSDMGLTVRLYQIPKGEIGFMAVPGSRDDRFQHQVWAYPTNQSPASVIRDASLREQLLARLPGDRPIRVHIPRKEHSEPSR